MALTWLGGGLAVTGVVLRGLSVARVPWGNMYEFATTGAAAVIAASLEGFDDPDNTFTHTWWALVG